MPALHAFTATPWTLTGDFQVANRALTISFQLSETPKEWNDALRAGIYTGQDMQRANELWKTTCFEAFWGIPGQPGYWELNLAAAAPRWNLYRFESYRQPQPPRESRDFTIEHLHTTATTLECRLLSAKPLPRLEASLTAILNVGGAIHYFASRHSGTKPDFHLRDSFILQTKPST